MIAVIRPYRSEDLGEVLRLWERSSAPDLLSVDHGVDLMRSGNAVTLVAEIQGTIVGVALGALAGAVGWVHRLALDGGPTEEVAQELLEGLEQRLGEAGARRFAAVGTLDGELLAHLARRGYEVDASVRYAHRAAPRQVAEPSRLAALGARMIDRGLWDQLKGMESAKEIIERRVILSLAEPELAARHAVVPPKAIVLFGPPGTGKTTFAKGIASRLEWPFIEIAPSELAGEGPEKQAKLLAEAFDAILELPAATIFVDEVEDLASERVEERRMSPSVTNEFLKQIPRIREVPHHLLICATNWVSRLDHAFLRPGRFDYVIPVGPPDEQARRAIWQRYADEITDEKIDVDRLVAASELFTAADIEFAARKAAQEAFEREHFEGVRHRATTEEFLAAITGTRPTLSAQMVETFERETELFARD